MQVDKTYIQQQVQAALAEDIGSGDVTAALLDPQQMAQAQVISREHAIVCGCEWFNQSFHQLDPGVTINWQVEDGDRLEPGQILCHISGKAHCILTAERTALNFLQTLSATATITHHYARLIKDYNTQVLDTRKTIPGLRRAQKYAVACGGGSNHRIGLYDMILIKENHIASAGGIGAALARAKKLYPDLPLEVEVENLHELQQALDNGAQRILLDNMPIAMLQQAIEINQGRAKLEASGNVTDETIKDIAATGVDYISIGALTKHVKAVDFSLLIL